MVWSADGEHLYAVENSRRFISCQKPNLACSTKGTLPIGVKGVYRLAVDKANNNIIFATVVQAVLPYNLPDYRQPQAFMSEDGGTNWRDISVTGSLYNTASLGAAVVYMVNRVAFGTSNGVLVPDGGFGVGWQVLAPGLPKVAILEMVYEALDDTLVVATLGRGVW
jgi:hypothetical protein